MTYVSVKKMYLILYSALTIQSAKNRVTYVVTNAILPSFMTFLFEIVVQWNLGLSNVKISKNLDLSNVFAPTVFLLSKSTSK